MDNIAGKVIVITGASSGIGAETASVLAREGAKVALGARRQERLEALAQEIRKDGGTAVVQETDVTRRSDVDRLVQRATDELGPVDVMINNAGIMPVAPMAMVRVDEWDQMIDVNVKGLLYGIAAVLPRMIERQRGHIINVASVAGHKVLPNFTVYCATKHAVRAISEGLRAEHPDIRVTIVSPGLIATELENSTNVADVREQVKAFYAQHAISPRAIADAIAYAINQPDEVDINELLIRPTTQDL